MLTAMAPTTAKTVCQVVKLSPSVLRRGSSPRDRRPTCPGVGRNHRAGEDKAAARFRVSRPLCGLLASGLRRIKDQRQGQRGGARQTGVRLSGLRGSQPEHRCRYGAVWLIG